MNVFESLFGPLTSAYKNIRRTKEIQIYLMNSCRNLCKFYDSTVKKDVKYLITNIVFFIKFKGYLSYLRLQLYVDEFDNILLNYVYLRRNSP